MKHEKLAPATRSQKTSWSQPSKVLVSSLTENLMSRLGLVEFWKARGLVSNWKPNVSVSSQSRNFRSCLHPWVKWYDFLFTCRRKYVYSHLLLFEMQQVICCKSNIFKHFFATRVFDASIGDDFIQTLPRPGVLVLLYGIV